MDSDNSRSVALMSIHPEYSTAIFAGTKRVEFRRTTLPPELRYVVVYATSPVMKIVGYFSVAQVRAGAASTIWRRYGDVGGISRSKFNSYYTGANRAIAIEIKTAYSFENPLPIDVLGVGIRPPQSFQYLPKAVLQRIAATTSEPRKVA